MTRTIVMLGLGLVMAAHAAAAPIYRCGPDGKTYSQVPCPEGSIVEATDPRTAAQRAEAKRFVEAERTRAAEQERERKAAEKQAPGAVAIGPTAADKAASAVDTGKPAKSKARTKGKKATSDDFTAVAPAEKPEKPAKAQRR